MYPMFIPMPIHSGGGCSGELGLFGTILETFIIFGTIGLFSYLAWDLRDDKAFVCFVIFTNIILFMIWIGAIFNLY